MDHTPKEIIFNRPHPSILLHISDKPSRNAILHLIQEIKRDIIYRRMNMTGNKEQVPLILIHAHIQSVITIIKALLEYQGSQPQSDLMLMIRVLTGTLQEMIE